MTIPAELDPPPLGAGAFDAVDVVGDVWVGVAFVVVVWVDLVVEEGDGAGVFSVVGTAVTGIPVTAGSRARGAFFDLSRVKVRVPDGPRTVNSEITWAFACPSASRCR